MTPDPENSKQEEKRSTASHLYHAFTIGIIRPGLPCIVGCAEKAVMPWQMESKSSSTEVQKPEQKYMAHQHFFT
jgi:hypothetical protein